MSTFFALLFYLAFALFALGLGYKIYDFARTPAPLKIPTTPAPVNAGGVVLRMAREVVLFESLFKSNLWIWGLGWLFHASLALVLLRHLRYFTEPVWAWVAFIQPFGMYAGITMLLGVAGLWARRLFVERIRYISTPSDHLMLVLLMAIALSGLTMTFAVPTDVIAVKSFFLGLMNFNWQALPSSVVLRPPVDGRAIAAGFSSQQIAARARRVLLSQPQPGGQPARETPHCCLGETYGIGELTWRISPHQPTASYPSFRR